MHVSTFYVTSYHEQVELLVTQMLTIFSLYLLENITTKNLSFVILLVSVANIFHRTCLIFANLVAS